MPVQREIPDITPWCFKDSCLLFAGIARLSEQQSGPCVLCSSLGLGRLLLLLMAIHLLCPPLSVEGKQWKHRPHLPH